jgi:hypothetical protein
MTKTEQFAQDWEIILGEIVSGKSLRATCKTRNIEVAQAYRWIAADKDREAAYRLAMDSRADTIGDQIEDIAQTLIELADNPEKAKQLTASQVQAYRVAMDGLRWKAGVMAPKRYGDKQQLNIIEEVDPRTAQEQLRALIKEVGPALQLVKETKAA